MHVNFSQHNHGLIKIISKLKSTSYLNQNIEINIIMLWPNTHEQKPLKKKKYMQTNKLLIHVILKHALFRNIIKSTQNTCYRIPPLSMHVYDFKYQQNYITSCVPENQKAMINQKLAFSLTCNNILHTISRVQTQEHALHIMGITNPWRN